MNLNQPNAVDTQCALNLIGTLCHIIYGCVELVSLHGLSLSLGSSKCLKCPSYWPALFVAITIFVIIAGIGLIIYIKSLLSIIACHYSSQIINKLILCYI